MKDVETKIKEILEEEKELPGKFKQALLKQDVLDEDEKIMDLIFIKREHMNTNIQSPIVSPATLLIATNEGVTIIEEGYVQIAQNYYGYKVKHYKYNMIASIELDICLLEGIFSISSNISDSCDNAITFDTSLYYTEFENFIKLIRKQ